MILRRKDVVIVSKVLQLKVGSQLVKIYPQLFFQQPSRLKAFAGEHPFLYLLLDVLLIALLSSNAKPQ